MRTNLSTGGPSGATDPIRHGPRRSAIAVWRRVAASASPQPTKSCPGGRPRVAPPSPSFPMAVRVMVELRIVQRRHSRAVEVIRVETRRPRAVGGH